jgi:hypothetical protein
MKQSAVEWLEFRYKNNVNLMDYDFEQAKQMEKQQIIDACESTSNTDFWVKYESFEQYSNETFKNK